MIKDIDISDLVKDALLKEVKGVYGNHMEQLKIIPQFTITRNQQTKAQPVAADNYGHLQGLDSNSIWFKIRKYLVDRCGVHVDKNWFSRLEVVDEDPVTKKLILKAPSCFIYDWIMRDYQTVLQCAFDTQNFSFEMTKY